MAFFGFFVGFGNAGMIAVDIPLVQEFVPTHKRGWVAGLTTTLLPAGNTFGALSGWLLEPMISWRGLFLVGLAPALLALMIRYWVPESLRFLMRLGRRDEARGSLAWALQCDPSEIELPTATADEETTRWRELFRYPRSMGAGCLIALSQTGGAGILRWITALFVMVLRWCSPVSPATPTAWPSRTAVLVSLDQRGVTFRYKDYRRDGRARFGTMTLMPNEFISAVCCTFCPTGSIASATTDCSPAPPATRTLRAPKS